MLFIYFSLEEWPEGQKLVSFTSCSSVTFLFWNFYPLKIGLLSTANYSADKTFSKIFNLDNASFFFFGKKNILRELTNESMKLCLGDELNQTHSERSS